MQFKRMTYAASVATVFCAMAISVCAQSDVKPIPVADKLANALVAGEFTPALDPTHTPTGFGIYNPRIRVELQSLSLTDKQDTLVVRVKDVYEYESQLQMTHDSLNHAKLPLPEETLKISLAALDKGGFTTESSTNTVNIYVKGSKTYLNESDVQLALEKALEGKYAMVSEQLKAAKAAADVERRAQRAAVTFDKAKDTAAKMADPDSRHLPSDRFSY